MQFVTILIVVTDVYVIMGLAVMARLVQILMNVLAHTMIVILMLNALIPSAAMIATVTLDGMVMAINALILTNVM